MITAPHLSAARRRAAAVRRYPPGCGRHHNAAHPPQHSGPSSTDGPLPNLSPRAATKTAPPPRKPLPAGNGSVDGIEGPAASAAVTVRRASAVRRYPPGCGRVAASKPEDWVGECDASASKLQTPACNGEAREIAGDRKVVPGGSVLECGSSGGGKSGGDGGDQNVELRENGDSGSNGGGRNGGDGGCAQEEEEGRGGQPLVAPLLPWAHHERRSQRGRRLL